MHAASSTDSPRPYDVRMTSSELFAGPLSYCLYETPIFQVHRLGPRIGGSPADCDDASWGSSEDASDAPPAGLERL